MTTLVRAEGGVFIGMVLAYWFASQGRLFAGLDFFAMIIAGAAGVRLVGLMLDGLGPFTLMG